ncbi:UNVERIFIED_CONTAM: hypothetical protein RMT77_017226 [Armadillidium vulgare]
MALPPLFPNLTPSLLDPAWIDIDRAVDLNQELRNQELGYHSQLEVIAMKGKDIIPIGNNASEQTSEDEEDGNDDDYDDDDDNDDEEEEDDSEMNDEYPDAIIQ